GRVVIPKEIRRTLRIREGDPLEIYTESNGEVIFKKYSPMGISVLKRLLRTQRNIIMMPCMNQTRDGCRARMTPCPL
ncbi:MAG: AbrB/MazE/SpoVT family DNA-binding domain-containing protein, partial [Selenomonas sp.]|nr:AbrB/MazE/SpoVT family DNA-binding domain-containing protein [Selenomonas sp.]